VVQSPLRTLYATRLSLSYDKQAGVLLCVITVITRFCSCSFLSQQPTRSLSPSADLAPFFRCILLCCYDSLFTLITFWIKPLCKHLHDNTLPFSGRLPIKDSITITSVQLPRSSAHCLPVCTPAQMDPEACTFAGLHPFNGL